MVSGKRHLRDTVIAQRQALSRDCREQASQAICARLCKHPAIQRADAIAVYHGTHGEANPFPITEQLTGKHWLLPIVNSNKHITFSAFDHSSKLIANKYGILEPEDRKKTLMPQQIDVILIPLVAFDLTGNRIGRGAGYYDRALSFMQHQSSTRPYLIGIAYEFQKVDCINADSWDIPLHAVITDKNDYTRR